MVQLSTRTTAFTDTRLLNNLPIVTITGWLLLLLQYATVNCSHAPSEVTVSTGEGLLRGYSNPVSVINDHVFEFLGIPFAQPPVGGLRFAPPLPALAWKEGTVKNATVKANPCVAMLDEAYGNFSGSNMWNDHRKQTEDCLQLNIWTPNNAAFNGNGEQKKAVMVWIYGGGFFSGSPSLDLYDASALAGINDVIVVNINYRLGPFGFLYLGDDSAAPGNAGLLDQQLALKWIYNNIEQFGGDTKKITIFGESAGAASVTGHMVAPGSRGLFSAAIAQSGTITNRWALVQPLVAKDRAKVLADKVDCCQETVSGMIECLKKVDYRIIQKKSEDMWDKVRFMEFPFVPVNQDTHFFEGQDARLALLEGRTAPVPLLAGLMKDEGSFWLSYFLPPVFEYKYTQSRGLVSVGAKDKNISVDEFNQCLHMAFDQYYTGAEVLVKSIAYQYTGDLSVMPAGNWSYALRDAVNQFVGDFCFSCDLLNLLNTLATQNRSAVYGYYFTERSSANQWPLWMGAMHGYEIEYIFGGPFLNPGDYDSKTLAKEQQFSREIMKLWTDFAKNGHPAAEWSRICGSADHLYQLGGDRLRRIDNPKKKYCDFWNSLNTVYSDGRSISVNGARPTAATSQATMLLLASSFLIINLRIYFPVMPGNSKRKDIKNHRKDIEILAKRGMSLPGKTT